MGYPPTAVLHQAAELYRGEFLAGFELPHQPEYSMWLAEQRAAWLRSYLNVLTALIEQLAPRDPATAIGYAQKYLQADSLAEHMHRRLMQLYLQQGQREAALRQFEQCKMLLHEEMGMAPLAETRALYQEIQRGSVSIGAAPAAVPPAVSPAVQASASAAEGLALPDAFQLPENLLRDFVEHVPAAVAMFDRNLRYLLASQRWYKDYRIEKADIIGCSHYDIFPKIPQRWRDKHQRILTGAVERCAADPFPRADGTLDWVRWEVRPWYTERNEIGGIVMFTQVITKQKKMETSLRRHRDHLEQLVSQRLVTLSTGQGASVAHQNLLQTLKSADLMRLVSTLADDLQNTLQKAQHVAAHNPVAADNPVTTERAAIKELLVQAETLVQGLQNATAAPPSSRQMPQILLRPAPS